MRFSLLLGGLGALTTVGLVAGLATVGMQNLNKPEQIARLQDQIINETYPTVPTESRRLTKIGPAYPSPGYEN